MIGVFFGTALNVGVADVERDDRSHEQTSRIRVAKERGRPSGCGLSPDRICDAEPRHVLIDGRQADQYRWDAESVDQQAYMLMVLELICRNKKHHRRFYKVCLENSESAGRRMRYECADQSAYQKKRQRQTIGTWDEILDATNVLYPD